jgi:hypothetical protein
MDFCLDITDAEIRERNLKPIRIQGFTRSTDKYIYQEIIGTVEGHRSNHRETTKAKQEYKSICIKQN